MLSLFPDEQVISESNNGFVTLTTHRICKEDRQLGKAYNQNIMLEHITSCENHYSDQKWMLFIGIALIGAAFIFIQARVLLMVVGVAFVIVYVLTRHNYIVIGSPSTKMKIKTLGMKRENVLNFINRIEHAKHERLLRVNKEKFKNARNINPIRNTGNCSR